MTTSTQREVATDGPVRFVSPMVVSAMAVVVIAVVAIALVVFSGGQPGPIATDSPTPTPTATATLEMTPSPIPRPTPTLSPIPSPVPIGRWVGLTWSDPVTPSPFVHVTDLVPWEGGYVAVGEVVVDATRSEAAFLTSPDGLHWTVRDQFDPGVVRFPRELVIVDGELLAFSHPNADALGLPGAWEWRMWRSADGMTWSAVDSQSWRDAWSGLWIGPIPASWDDLQQPIATGLVDVAGGPAGLVAIGNSYGDDGMVPVVLHSTDGRDWSAVGLPADSESPLLHAVVPYGDGFVLVGAVNAGPVVETATPAAWYSSDGVSWRSGTVKADPQLFPVGTVGMRGEMRAATAGSEGLVGWWSQRGLTAADRGPLRRGLRQMAGRGSRATRTPRGPGCHPGTSRAMACIWSRSALPRTWPLIPPCGRASARRGSRWMASTGPR